MSIFKKRGLKEKDIVDLMDKLDAAPPSPTLASGGPFVLAEPEPCSYCGEVSKGAFLSVKVEDTAGGTKESRKVCWSCGILALDGIVKLFTGQTRKEKA